jgi:hypothetical protein
LTEAKARNKKNVDLISSHSDNEEDDNPFLLCEEGPAGLAQPQQWTNENLPPHTLPLRLRPGETFVEYNEYIPDVDHGNNEYCMKQRSRARMYPQTMPFEYTALFLAQRSSSMPK